MSTDSNTEQNIKHLRKVAPDTTHAEHGHVIFFITSGGRVLAEKICGLYPEAEVLKFKSALFADRWQVARNIICIMAAGIVVRASAPLLKDKRTDPAVVVLDEAGQYVISLLSGHLGGANMLARDIADYLGADAVITTASDVLGKMTLDLWAMEKGLYVEDFNRLKKLSMKIVNGGKVRVFTQYPIKTSHMPDEFTMVDSEERADIIISTRKKEVNALFLRPRNLYAGIGCNRGTTREEIESVIDDVFRESGLSRNSIGGLATIDIKSDEQGIIEYARARELTIGFFSKDELNRVAEENNIARSEHAAAATGAVAVAEPAAILEAIKHFGNCELTLLKQKRGNVTLAIAKAEFIL